LEAVVRNLRAAPGDVFTEGKEVRVRFGPVPEDGVAQVPNLGETRIGIDQYSARYFRQPRPNRVHTGHVDENVCRMSYTYGLRGAGTDPGVGVGVKVGPPIVQTKPPKAGTSVVDTVAVVFRELE
jgi:hypothetical protein